MNDILKKYKKYLLFIIPVLLSLIITCKYNYVTHGSMWDNVFFFDKNDGFMDFFNSITHTFGDNIYKNPSIYPPLIYYMYEMFGHMIPNSVLYSNVYDMSSSYEGQIIYLLYTLICIFMIIYSVNKLNKSNKLNTLIVSTFIFSFPVIYCFQRGNAIILACTFSILYFAFYDADNKYLKHLSLISLAISANIKLYPALFGLLLIKDKRYKDAIICAFYGIILFILPFFSFGGIEAIKSFIDNILNTSSYIPEMSQNYLISFESTITLLSKAMNINITSSLINIFVYTLAILSIIPFFSLNKRYKQILLLIVIFIGFPLLSYTYVLVFLIIPIIILINEDKSEKLDYVYLIIMSILLSTIGFIPVINGYYAFIIIEKILVFILMIIIIVDGYISFFKKGKIKLCQK